MYDMTAPTSSGQAGPRPYAEASAIYLVAGWPGPLPLHDPSRPDRRWHKTPPPTGTTGHLAGWPSEARVRGWLEDPVLSAANIGLRLPPGVIGLDVDAYDGRTGLATLTAAEERWGALPPTWSSSSRRDGSRIMFFQVPYSPDHTWAEIGPHVETVQHTHRYAVVWPSVHPDTGRTYMWMEPGGRVRVDGTVPRVADLARLPEKWIRGMRRETSHAKAAKGATMRQTRGEVSGAAPLVRGDMHASRQATAELIRGFEPGPMCQRISGRLSEALDGLAGAVGSRHDTTVAASMSLISLGAVGHHGAADALMQLRDAFYSATSDGTRRGDGAGAEWARMLTGAAAIVAADPPRQRHCCGDTRADLAALLMDVDAVPDASDDAATQSDAGGGGADVSAGQPVGRGWSGPDISGGAEFWERTPALRTIRDMSRSRGVGPWALLGAVLTMVGARTGPHVQLPAVVVSRASLNTLIGLVGESGGGKTGALSVAVDAWGLPDQVQQHEIGTAQGFTSAFVRPARKGETKSVQIADSALFTLDEIKSLSAHAAMTGGSLVLQTLKSAYSGTQLGARYADTARRRTVAAHRYRASVIAGIQPRHADALLADVDGGLPQRWLWLPAAGVDVTEEMLGAEVVDRVGGLIQIPAAYRAVGECDDELGVGPRDVIELAVCDTARREIVAARVRHVRGEAGDDPYGGHRLLTQLKVAGLLGILHGTDGVDEDMWALAAEVMGVSEATRDMCVRLAADDAAKRELGKRIAEGVGSAISAQERAARVDAATERVAQVILRALERSPQSGGWSGRELRRMVASGDAAYRTAAIELLVSDGELTTGADGRYHRAD